MKYEKGYIDELPNDSGVYTGNIDLRDSCWSGKIEVHGSERGEVDGIMTRIVDELNGTEIPEKEPNYAASFNAWQSDYCNNPQAYEDSQTVAIRHLTEKLNGEEPSYGQVAAQMLIEYLNKTESK